MYTLIPGKSHPFEGEDKTRQTVRAVLTKFNDDKARGGEGRDKTAKAGWVRSSKSELFMPLKDPEVERHPLVDWSPRSKPRRARLPLQRRHIWFIGFGLLTIFKPWWLVIGIAAISLIVLGALYIAGAEAIWRGVLLGIRQIRIRDPKRGVRMRRRLEHFERRWNGCLDRLPDSWCNGLYVPDLRALEVEDLDQSEMIAEKQCYRHAAE